MVTQGQNHIDSPANMLQQQHSYEVSEKKHFHFITTGCWKESVGVVPEF